MQWVQTITRSVDPHRPQLVNDSKTPSGRVHVGALRGVLIHDVIFRALTALRVPARYTFGVDDYDPLDEIPAGHQELFAPYLGRPLFSVPAPPGSAASDLAEHYISEFFGVFRDLGVRAETYRMRDVYRSGRFNDDIRTILSNAHTVRRLYKEVSNSDRPDDWYPFQAVCESCGRIGTTRVFDFDGARVRYQCRHALVSWAEGCGYEGQVSPYDGNGKLPWKLEWVAKWHTFGVTIEGAGKDHTTRGGSREVAAAILRELFEQEPPKNIPYEFFLVGGAKMSSSKGIGASAREIADLLPPEVLRFLVLKSPPSRPVNFSPTEDHIVKLFNEFDRLRAAAGAGSATEQETQLFRMCLPEPDAAAAGYEPPFQLLVTLIQMPHVDVEQEASRRKGTPLTDAELVRLRRRVESARYWLANYASDDERLVVQQALPERASRLSASERAFLHKLAAALVGVPWEEEALQSAIFDTARQTPLPSVRAFEALYRVFLDRSSGPRAGSLLAFLNPSFVAQRLQALPYSVLQFWRETSEPLDRAEAWLAENQRDIKELAVRFDALLVSVPPPADGTMAAALQGAAVVELQYVDSKRQKRVRRAPFSRIAARDATVESESARLHAEAARYVGDLAGRHALAPLSHTMSVRSEDLASVHEL